MLRSVLNPTAILKRFIAIIAAIQINYMYYTHLGILLHWDLIAKEKLFGCDIKSSAWPQDKAECIVSMHTLASQTSVFPSVTMFNQSYCLLCSGLT